MLLVDPIGGGVLLDDSGNKGKKVPGGQVESLP